MNSIQFFSAFGLGAVFVAMFKICATRWNLNFQEKKEAYVGFLKALHRQEVEKTEESALFVDHWNDVCELVG